MEKDKLPFDLAGQTMLITGAAGGIGRETARLCAAAGARLVLADVVPAERTAEVNADWAADARILQCDSSRREAVEAMAREIGPIDILADTGGVCPRDDWMAEDWDAAFDHVIDVNLRGPINLVRAFLPGMRERKYGRIVLCGSIAGWTGGVRSSPHYTAAKGGVHALVRWFAQRATADNVCVNGVAPGPVDSDMTVGQGYTPDVFPLKRMGRTDELANLIAFLCSPGASFIAGTVIDANGAVYMR